MFIVSYASWYWKVTDDSGEIGSATYGLMTGYGPGLSSEDCIPSMERRGDGDADKSGVTSVVYIPSPVGMWALKVLIFCRPNFRESIEYSFLTRSVLV